MSVSDAGEIGLLVLRGTVRSCEYFACLSLRLLYTTMGLAFSNSLTMYHIAAIVINIVTPRTESEMILSLGVSVPVPLSSRMTPI